MLTLQPLSELNNTEASFIGDGGVSVDQRKMNAVRAYFEWMPIRQVEMDDNLRIWRSFSIGTLLDLIMLDVISIHTHSLNTDPVLIILCRLVITIDPSPICTGTHITVRYMAHSHREDIADTFQSTKSLTTRAAR